MTVVHKSLPDTQHHPRERRRVLSLAARVPPALLRPVLVDVAYLSSCVSPLLPSSCCRGTFFVRQSLIPGTHDPGALQTCNCVLFVSHRGGPLPFAFVIFLTDSGCVAVRERQAQQAAAALTATQRIKKKKKTLSKKTRLLSWGMQSVESRG